MIGCLRRLTRMRAWSTLEWPNISTRLSSTDTKEGEPGQVVSIDRSGLYNPAPHSHETSKKKEPESALTRQLKALIQFRGGPITMAEYMSEALTNPTAGYYMKRDVFGQSGDFVTSPEISQLFGEMVGIWCVLQWQKLGSPKELRLVELGPGRGTLMADLLRGVGALPCPTDALHVHLVEVSEAMRRIQKTTLGYDEESAKHRESTASPLSTLSNKLDLQVNWHRSLDEVPEDLPAIYIAHEFFDALPAHQFMKTERGWCERLIDVSGPESPYHFRLVLSPGPTPASKLLLQRRLELMDPNQRENLKRIEVSGQAFLAAESLAKRVSKGQASALIIDYGQDSHFDASIQAIKDHKFVSFLSQPGEADLSCRVDFSALRQAAQHCGGDVNVHGPLPQAYFLAGLGIETRLNSLLPNSTEEQQNSLIQGYNRIVGGEEKSSESAESSEKSENIGDLDDGSEDRSLGGKGYEKSDEKMASEWKDLSEKLSKSYDEEGMGFSYKVMAFTHKNHPPPEPFPGSGIEFGS